jgi:thiol-disulfide isomerase/thioredoxin
LTWAALMGITAAGCGDSSPSQPPPVPADAADAVAEKAPSASASRPPAEHAGAAAGDRDGSRAGKDVSLRIIEGDDFPEVLKQYRGKVVLADFWATWCLSCLEQFPHTVELSERFADRGLVVISVSLNVADEEPQVRGKLAEFGATFDNFLSRDGMSDEALEGFGLKDGILPQYRLFDREGNLHRSFSISDGLFNVGQIDQAVEELLGPPPSLH